MQRTDLIRRQQTIAWKIPVLRVQLPGSYPTEYQWQFETIQGQEWTEEEMAPIEEALLMHMSYQANTTWKFCKGEEYLYFTRPNWQYTMRKHTPQEVAEYIHHHYKRGSVKEDA